MKTKPSKQERALITSEPEKRPFGARAFVHLQTAGIIGAPEGVSLLLDGGQIVTIQPAHKAPWEAGDKFELALVGFRNAADAEAAGRRLVQAVLWTAVSMRFALRIDYSTFEPTVVFDRRSGGGTSMSGYGFSGRSLEAVLGEVRVAYGALPASGESLLLSMELFSSAELEVSPRARFISLVSALEPLAEPESLGVEANAFVDRCAAVLRETEGLTSTARNSLSGRLEQLRMESIRQALLRFVKLTLPDEPGAPRIVDEAYALRSQFAHRGKPDDFDLDTAHLGRQVSSVLRLIYSALLNRDLIAPATID